MPVDGLQKAKEHFGKLLEQQLARVESMKQAEDWVDYSKLDTIKIGIAGGDGIGPYICDETRKVVAYILADEVKSGKIRFVEIDGLTIENRYKHMKAIPDDVLAAIKECHVVLKGPTETPKKGDARGELESANVVMRRELDLFANVRPVSVPEEGIDWIFFRENTEGEYVLGSKGFEVTPDLAVDFKVTTTQGTTRIVRAALDYAKKKGIKKVTVITKANVVKATDGKFSAIAHKLKQEYPEIEMDEWYIDIMAAKLIDPARRSEFKVMVMPNLYGDILTDEAAQIQGGVGTAGSANIGRRYAMFEAIHGSGNRMVDEGRAAYADPSSMLRAAVLMMEHLGFARRARKLSMAMDVCHLFEKKIVCSGHKNSATTAEFGKYIMDTCMDPKLEARWKAYKAK